MKLFLRLEPDCKNIIPAYILLAAIGFCIWHLFLYSDKNVYYLTKRRFVCGLYGNLP